ncbi:MAG TPA: DUF6029 family protein [Bacteroidales bacterium]|nr:DUF6029 family protein [Bacteroidales bacterium]HPI87310.1 DUF6029 family protein [Bacteroidales bacterium]
MRYIRTLFLISLLMMGAAAVRAQENSLNPTVHGNFQLDAQSYMTDEALGITDSVLQGKSMRMNGYGDIRFSMWRFNAGIRYEALMPPLAGYDQQYQGQGIPYWFVDYGDEKLQVTAGHFYEQFGMGMILRSYQQWDLGYDNSINGLRVKYSPVAGLNFKALIGTQRYYWERFEDDNRGVVRGFDGELMLNDAFKAMKEKKTRIILGGSFVSKYEKMRTKSLVVDTVKYEYQLPENVAAAAGRLTISNGGFNFYSEYVYKFNNPSAYNNFIYKPGEAFLASLSYSQKGLGIFVAAKRIDNMSYKSKMTELNNVLDINYIPPLTKQFVYSLENVYPYATQLNGETAFQGQVVYTVPKGTKLGGKYGTKFELNFSRTHGLDKEPVEEGIPVDSTGTDGYKAPWLSLGDLYHQSISATMEKKMGKKMKLILEYVYIDYNIAVVEGHPGAEMVHAHEYNVDFTYKLTPTKSLRVEYEQLLTKQDRGDWAMLLVEYNVAPKWFFSVMDQYNYGNPDEDMKLHYYTAALAFVEGPHRIALSYGRQREGLLCVGGVCRQVPASNGFTLNVSTSF